jgi:hypothetical protein
MKFIIRKKCFETNSSSTHSISLAGSDKQFLFDTIYPDQKGKIVVSGEFEFGWQWEKINDPISKLAYAFLDGVNKELLIKVVKEQTGATEVVFNIDGYIDHQSHGTATSLCKNEEITRDFIFNKNSWLFTGNDNSPAEPSFYNVPEYKDGKIILPEYKYEFVLEGYKEKIKFLNYPTKEELRGTIDIITDDLYVTNEGHIFKENNIYFKISKSDDYYICDYNCHEYCQDGYLLFIKERLYYKIEDQLRLEKKLDGINFYDRNKIIFEEILKNDSFFKKIHYTINKI